MEFNGYSQEAFQQKVSHIFNAEQVSLISDKLGKSIYFKHLFAELIKSRSVDETFTQLLEVRDDPVFSKIRRQYEHRLNKLFLHPSLGHLLDSGEIDFAVMQIFEQLVKTGRAGGSMALSFYARNELIVSPMFEALFDCNIIWKSKYYDYFALEHRLYAEVMEEWLTQRKQSMNAHEQA